MDRVYVLNRTLNIANNTAADVHPSSSPDGKQIPFVSTRSI